MTRPVRIVEMIRRWLRGGRAGPAEALPPPPEPLPIPEALRRFGSGRPQPDWAEAIHRSRGDR